MLLVATVVQAEAGSVASRAGIAVYGPISEYKPLGDAAWGPSKSAVATWVHPSWPTIGGATWVSSADYVEAPYSANSWRWFHDEMVLACSAYNIAASSVSATSDNAEEFYFNGALVGSDGEVQGAYVDNQEWSTVQTYPVSPHAGTNTLDFIVRNYAGENSPTSNPTGLVYKSAAVSYSLPDVIWLPPITNADFALQDGTTLPIKFRLSQGMTLITDMQGVNVAVVYGDGPGGDAIRTYSLGDGVEFLRFDAVENYYIANFKTKDFGLADGMYTAVVRDNCSGEVLGYWPFTLSTASGTGRGNSGK